MSATAPARSKRPRRRMSITAAPSDLDVHDLLDHERAAHDHDYAHREHHPSGRMSEEGLHIGRVDRRDHQEQADRQKRDDPAREASLRREASHQSAESGAFTDALDHSVEHLGRVAAGLPLKRRDQRHLLDVAAWHAPRDDAERVLQRNAELLVGDYALELAARGLGCVLDHQREAADQAVPGAQTRSYDIEIVWELVSERPPLLFDFVQDEPADEERHRKAEQREWLGDDYRH